MKKLSEEDPIDVCPMCGRFADECTCEIVLDDDTPVYDDDEEIPDILDRMSMGDMRWSDEDLD